MLELEENWLKNSIKNRKLINYVLSQHLIPEKNCSFFTSDTIFTDRAL